MGSLGGITAGKAMALGLALLACLVTGTTCQGPLYGTIGAARGLIETGATVFNVTQYGAKANGKTDDALAFIKAWNAACHNSGPAKLVIPAGTYLCSPVTAWPYNDCKQNSDCQHLPVSLKFNKVNNTIVDGVTSLNSMGFHFSLTFSQNFTGVNLNITAPDESPNTDGIHLSSSDRINISNSFIGTGDDCIGIIQGTTNVTITQITCGPGHGISIGSLGKYPKEKDVIGVHVRNATLTNTTNGVRIKTYPGEKQLLASDIIFEDIVMNTVMNPIIINQNYGSKKVTKPSSVKVSDVHFKNIRGTTVSEVAVTLLCSSSNPCDPVELSDIDLSFARDSSGSKSITSSCTNAKPTFIVTQNPPACQ
ncbi:hypothetical protein BT93_C2514 [Corymbia citriodora subsp. variegata]|nr:hypothetical protein BT93_C2514 [Corymbia citriodora subsp. variegata]